MATKTPKSMSADHEKAMNKLRGKLGLLLSLILILGIIFTIMGWVNSIKSNAVTRQQTRSVEQAQIAQQNEATREQVERRKASTLSAIEGTWSVKGVDSPVYVGSYKIGRDGSLEQFSFEYSFTNHSTGEAHSNTWSCSQERQTKDRYSCEWRQRWDGGSLRESAFLTQTSDRTFSGRYMYRNEWREIEFSKVN